MKTKSKLNVKFTFKPFSKKQLQVLFWWQSPQYKDKFAIIADGSVRAGKTVIMSFSYVRWAMMNFDGVNFGMAGKTIGSLRRNVIRDLKRMLISEHYHVKDNQSENMLTVSKNGKTNYFFLFGGTNEASQDLVQGITLGGFFFDEVALMPESFVAQATSRLSVEGSKAWFNCNPDSPYHWFKLQWIDQLAKKNAIRIHFLMKDNPSLSEETLRRYDSMYSGVFYLRYILGQWAMADGLVYDNFDREKMVVDIPKEPVWEKQWISIDYGTQNATVFKLWSLFKGTWYNNAEYYYSGRETGRQKTDEQYIDDLEDFFFEHDLSRKNVKLIVDPSAASFKKALRNRGFGVVNANNNVLDGVRFMMTQMNLGKMKWTEASQHTLKEFGSYMWDKKAADRGEDAVVKEHDHCLDADRYFAMKVLYVKKQRNIKLRKEGI
ncbi:MULTISPECIES: PBSX family phage terminase large subunit [Bacillota]|jgi:phage terminase, large subunit, PBSX family|uniref:PBSX family phage terminase large subunit n=3 Tax=Ligilactobacillus murinus TaxID=1622 RepID=A0A4S2ENG8_9LACO|nr:MULTISPECIES: PBSX family phage terminase large subunit [Bacillota]NBH86832.1 PBSX family phage terminase large subunit [Lachnospiraceae bacterium]MBF0702314.1 PBSX family phage terminase large subunit [Ligilactobacillus murinus]MBX9013574.1 PBSX family phage terminase large subunit [Ligilactobacillus murinus]MCR1880915.1 PBSX family phage terminase large subunit [Ligilactobacillus murinus]MCZ0673218.1 PBSX family phage terminase large subunit [Ligilactobacillus murinus]